MTSFTDALRAADALTGQLQAMLEQPAFSPRFHDALFGLRTAAGSARDAFAGRHGMGDGAGAGELPLFATVSDRCDRATAVARVTAPDEAGVSRLTTFVEQAIAALQGASATPPRPALRGTLRLRSASVARAGVRAGPAASMAEPYYASLVKLFPVEAVTLYPLAIGIAGSSTGIRLVLIGIITLFVVVLRWLATQEAGGGAPDVPAIVVSVVSFLLYAGALGGFGYLPGGVEQTHQLLAFITIMWVALVPFVLRRARR